MSAEVKEEQNLQNAGAAVLDPEIEEMFRAGLYLGYSRTRRHPKMKPYIFGLRNNVEVLDLEKIREKLREAEDFLKKLAADKGAVLLVGAKPSVAPLIEKIGEELGMPYSAKRWPGGLMTNFNVMRKRLDHLEDLKIKKASGDFAKYTKKEQLVLNDEIMRLENKFAGLTLLKKVPEAMIIVDPREEKTATREAKKMKIKTVGIMNVDCDPDSVVYPIPANDSAHSSVKYILSRLSSAYKSGIPAVEAQTDIAAAEENKENKKTENNG